MPAVFSLVTRYHSSIRAFLILTYVSGIIGLQIPSSAIYFRPLSPFTLVLSLVILLSYHTDWRPAFYLYIAFTLLTGYFVEVLGVHTGQIFGRYAYGEGLGVQVLSVPPVIAVNWLILSYCCGSVCDRLAIPLWLKILTAATLMILLDLFIEPVAVRLDFWTWFGQPVPWQNYAAWWLVSVGLFAVWYLLPFKKENRLAKWLLSLQFIFFVGQFLFMIF